MTPICDFSFDYPPLLICITSSIIWLSKSRRLCKSTGPTTPLPPSALHHLLCQNRSSINRKGRRITSSTDDVFRMASSTTRRPSQNRWTSSRIIILPPPPHLASGQHNLCNFRVKCFLTFLFYAHFVWYWFFDSNSDFFWPFYWFLIFWVAIPVVTFS